MCIYYLERSGEEAGSTCLRWRDIHVNWDSSDKDIVCGMNATSGSSNCLADECVMDGLVIIG